MALLETKIIIFHKLAYARNNCKFTFRCLFISLCHSQYFLVVDKYQNCFLTVRVDTSRYEHITKHTYSRPSAVYFHKNNKQPTRNNL
jgi:hypothetical protein